MFARMCLQWPGQPDKIVLLYRGLEVMNNSWRKAAALVVLAAASLCTWAQGDDAVARIRALPWITGPSSGQIAGKATVDLAGMRFLDTGATDQFLQISGNLPRGNAYFLSKDDLSWWSILDFKPEGFVKDDEQIDAAQLMSQLQQTQTHATEERRRRGLHVLTIEDWALPPQYDRVNKRLEWAVRLRDDQNVPTINYETKLLGRSGFITATLVTSSERFQADVAEFKQALTKVQYVPGERYSEFKEGDKVAAYGLGALIVGGAAAVATKKGFWAVLGGALAAGWKLVAAIFVAALAGFKNVFKKKA